MKCIMCSGKTVLKNVDYRELGILLGHFKGNVCEKCGETYFDEQAAEQIQQKSKDLGLFGLSKKAIVAELGNSIAIRVPKEIAAFLNLKKGHEVTLVPTDQHGLLVQV